MRSHALLKTNVIFSDTTLSPMPVISWDAACNKLRLIDDFIKIQVHLRITVKRLTTFINNYVAASLQKNASRFMGAGISETRPPIRIAEWLVCG